MPSEVHSSGSGVQDWGDEQCLSPVPHTQATLSHHRSSQLPLCWASYHVYLISVVDHGFPAEGECFFILYWLYLLTSINCLGTERPSLAGAMNSQPHPALQSNIQKFPESLTGSPTSSFLNRADEHVPRQSCVSSSGKESDSGTSLLSGFLRLPPSRGAWGPSRLSWGSAS